jgi:hypothetical protein
MNYDELKNKVDEYMESQSRLLPSQKVLNELLSLLSDSKRYIDYCLELREIVENNIETILVAEFFFIDCSRVFYEQSILKIAIVLDNDTNTMNIEKFFNILNSTDIKNINKNTSAVNKKIEIDRDILDKIRIDFKDFKNKRDKVIAHYDLENIKKDYIVSLDTNTLLDIQSRTYDLIESYFKLLDLPEPSGLTDYKSFGILTGLDTLNSVITRGLNELDFSDNERMQKVMKSVEINREMKKIDEEIKKLSS